ncbi:aconitate hydratase [Blastocladiella emersonii ATCC 22665]|nr:aconitate hydratase [Blastocladiella emersonii ATCC 22665]
MYSRLAQCNRAAAPSRALGLRSRRSLASISDAHVAQFARDTPFPDYARLTSRLAVAREATGGRPLTLAEKYLFAHLADPRSASSAVRGSSALLLRPDRVAMQDASAQTAILQFMQAALPASRVPVSVHCDHLIAADTSSGTARDGASVAAANVATSYTENAEIYTFLSSASRRFGFDFWAPGNGIIHSLVLENYAAPGMLLLGTDSHTPNAGGAGAMAIGVGGADAVDAMCGIPWELAAPRVTGIRLTGKLQGWTSPKDVALYLLGQLTVRGGTGHILEYFGDALDTLSATACATIANMGAEMGATTSIFAYSDAIRTYLTHTHRGHLVSTLDSVRAPLLSADPEVHAAPGQYYDRVIEIDLSTLEPHLNGPFSPDRAIPLSQLRARAAAEGWPLAVSAALIGSCTNSSYEDMGRAADVLTSAVAAGAAPPATSLLVTPGSDAIRATLDRDGLTAKLTRVGATVLANACGPCIGQWKRGAGSESTAGPNVMVSSFNRNFAGRNDGNAQTLHFLASPETVAALALGGSLAFNPATDTLPAADGSDRAVTLRPPAADLPRLPARGFAAPAVHAERGAPDASVAVEIPPGSSRLERLPTWAAWGGGEVGGRVLVRVRGKCTTDHISAAGPWLKYKGHLTNIARNTLMTAVNDETGAVGTTLDVNGSSAAPIPDVARRLAAAGVPWVVVGDTNYGEGSAREHAALQVRFLGCPLVVARSFARIHETNLKKQGVVPLTFADPDVGYARMAAGVRIETHGLIGLMARAAEASGTTEGDVVDPHAVQLVVLDTAGEIVGEPIYMVNSLTRNQLAWIRAGGALNAIQAAQQAA